MVFPTLTAIYAAVLALIYFALSIWVVIGRAQVRAVHGDGGNDALMRRIRSHANFAEYVPMILALVGLLEAGGAGRSAIHAMLLVLVAARIMHPIGMVAREGTFQQFAFRAPGAMATWMVMVAAAVSLLIRWL